MGRARGERPVIESIIIRQMADECPDISWLGEYSDRIPPGADRRRGDFIFRHKAGSREFRYFIPGQAMVPEIREDLQAQGYSRGVAEEMARAQIREDFKRMEGFGNSWGMIGIEAVAVVKYRIRPNVGDWRFERFSSCGLWGVENDAGDYIEEIERGEIADLRNHLERFGIRVNKNEWAKLTANIERKGV